MANYTYFIMDDSFKHERKYRPDFGADDYTARYILGKHGVKYRTAEAGGLQQPPIQCGLPLSQ